MRSCPGHILVPILDEQEEDQRRREEGGSTESLMRLQDSLPHDDSETQEPK